MSSFLWKLAATAEDLYDKVNMDNLQREQEELAERKLVSRSENGERNKMLKVGGGDVAAGHGGAGLGRKGGDERSRGGRVERDGGIVVIDVTHNHNHGAASSSSAATAPAIISAADLLSEEELALLGKPPSADGSGGSGSAILGAAVQWGQTALASLREPEPSGGGGGGSSSGGGGSETASSSSALSLESGDEVELHRKSKNSKKHKKRTRARKGPVGRYESGDASSKPAATGQQQAQEAAVVGPERSMLPGNSAAAKLRVVSTCVAENKAVLASCAGLFLMWWILG